MVGGNHNMKYYIKKVAAVERLRTTDLRLGWIHFCLELTSKELMVKTKSTTHPWDENN